jgi:hypothetical protein
MINPDFWRSELIGWIGIVVMIVLPAIALYQARTFVKKL